MRPTAPSIHSHNMAQNSSSSSESRDFRSQTSNRQIGFVFRVGSSVASETLYLDGTEKIEALLAFIKKEHAVPDEKKAQFVVAGVYVETDLTRYHERMEKFTPEQIQQGRVNVFFAETMNELWEKKPDAHAFSVFFR